MYVAQTFDVDVRICAYLRTSMALPKVVIATIAIGFDEMEKNPIYTALALFPQLPANTPLLFFPSLPPNRKELFQLVYSISQANNKTRTKKNWHVCVFPSIRGNYISFIYY